MALITSTVILIVLIAAHPGFLHLCTFASFDFLGFRFLFNRAFILAILTAPPHPPASLNCFNMPQPLSSLPPLSAMINKLSPLYASVTQVDMPVDRVAGRVRVCDTSFLDLSESLVILYTVIRVSGISLGPEKQSL